MALLTKFYAYFNASHFLGCIFGVGNLKVIPDSRWQHSHNFFNLCGCVHTIRLAKQQALQLHFHTVRNLDYYFF